MDGSSGPCIRLARPDDAPTLPDVERSAGRLFLQLPDLAWIAGDTVQDEARHRELIGKGTEWVAVDGRDRPIGFLSAGIEGNALHIFELSVSEPFQRQGLGKALVRQAIAFAEDHALASVTLTTFRDVAWNAPFYQRLGFHVLARDETDARLTGILETEALFGIPIERRCAMRLQIFKHRRRGTEL